MVKQLKLPLTILPFTLVLAIFQQIPPQPVDVAMEPPAVIQHTKQKIKHELRQSWQRMLTWQQRQTQRESSSLPSPHCSLRCQ